jgi:hypothetical protein
MILCPRIFPKTNMLQLPSRCRFLQDSGLGFGSLALASPLSQETNANPLAQKQPHFPAKTKSVIWLFMTGGPSQVDTWDYKPELQKRDGQDVAGAVPKTDFFTASTPISRPPRAGRSQDTRPAGRHAGHLGRRVRSHDRLTRGEGTRPQSKRLHHLDGRRRRETRPALRSDRSLRLQSSREEGPVNELHATLLHLIGLNHEELTYRVNGRDFRLTDVAGRVINEILA